MNIMLDLLKIFHNTNSLFKVKTCACRTADILNCCSSGLVYQWSTSAIKCRILRLAGNISLSIGSSFSFSLDTRRTTSHEAVTRKKRVSPSRLRRNQRRKEEFLKRKTDPSSEKESEAFKCEECGNSYKSENGLKIHKGKSHKKANTLPSPEKIRRSSGDSPMESSLNMSPIRDTGREELQEQEAEQKETEVSPFISAHSKEKRRTESRLL